MRDAFTKFSERIQVEEIKQFKVKKVIRKKSDSMRIDLNEPVKFVDSDSIIEVSVRLDSNNLESGH